MEHLVSFDGIIYSSLRVPVTSAIMSPTASTLFISDIWFLSRSLFTSIDLVSPDYDYCRAASRLGVSLSSSDTLMEERDSVFTQRVTLSPSTRINVNEPANQDPMSEKRRLTADLSAQGKVPASLVKESSREQNVAQGRMTMDSVKSTLSRATQERLPQLKTNRSEESSVTSYVLS